MTCRTDAQLIRRLAVTRAALAGWRKEYSDAPANRDPAAWEDFLERHHLGRRAPQRATFPKGGLRAYVEERIGIAEMVLGQASLKIQDCAPERCAKFEATRRKLVPIAEDLFAQAAKL